MYSVEDSGKGKFSKTGYKVLKESGKYSLLEIDLFTGRKKPNSSSFSRKGASWNCYKKVDK